MKEDILFKGKIQLSKFEQDIQTKIWYLEFENEIFFQTSSFWRLTYMNKLTFISLDNQLKYSTHSPIIELGNAVKEYIGFSNLLEIKRDSELFDLIFVFENNVRVVFFTSSMALENGTLTVKDKTYYFLQGGNIA